MDDRHPKRRKDKYNPYTVRKMSILTVAPILGVSMDAHPIDSAKHTEYNLLYKSYSVRC